MSAESAPEGTVAVVAVPQAHAAKVRDFATSLMEDQTPEVEGYAAMIKGIGDVGGGMRPDGDGLKLGGMGINALSGSDCSLTKKKDFECGDED